MCGVSGVLSTHAYALTTPPIAWVSAHVSRFFGSDDSDAEEDDAAYGRVRSNSLDMLLAAADKSDHEGPSLSPNDSSGRQAGTHMLMYSLMLTLRGRCFCFRICCFLLVLW